MLEGGAGVGTPAPPPMDLNLAGVAGTFDASTLRRSRGRIYPGAGMAVFLATGGAWSLLFIPSNGELESGLVLAGGALVAGFGFYSVGRV
jgi:hypothetical protein